MTPLREPGAKSVMQRLFPGIPATLIVLALLTGTFSGAHPGIDQQIADINERIEAEPANGSLYLRRGELHRIHRDWPLSEADYRRALQLDPELAIVDQALGRMLLESGQAKKALAPLKTYLKNCPEATTAHALLGRAFMQLGRYLDSAESYARALASLKDGKPRPEYFLERARALAAAGKEHRKAAIECLDDGLQVLNYPVTLQLYAIELETALRRYDSALARLDQIASRSARKETWLVQRGEILEQAGRPELAREAYENTLDAIAALPPARANNRAVERVREQATAGIERLDKQKDEPESGATP